MFAAERPQPNEIAVYELLEHTADVKVRLWAPDLAGLYASAVEMMRGVLVGESPGEGRAAVELAPEVDDAGERFFRFVRELVYLHDVERFVPSCLTGMDPPTVAGEAFDARVVDEKGLVHAEVVGYRTVALPERRTLPV